MWSIARITILGSCVAGGVAAAVGLAGHFSNAETDEPTKALAQAKSSNQQPAVSFESMPSPDKATDSQIASPGVSPHEPVGPLPKEVPLAGQAQPAKNQQAAFPPAPYYMHYQDPVSDKIERLEKALQRVTEASTQSQIKRLEEQLAELSRANNAAAQATAATAAAQEAEAATEPADDKSDADEPQVAQPSPAELDLDEIRRGEGDDRLKLNLRGQDLRELLEFLSAEADLNILASESVTGTVTASLSDMDAESAIRAILRIKGFVAKRDGKFLYVGTPADLQQMEHLSETIQTRIYRTDYVTAAEVQALITPMLSTDGKVTVSSPAETTIPADSVKTGGDDFAGNEVIMVQDYEHILHRIDDLVAQVDQRPRQVMIEAMIISVGLDDSHSVGINFEAFQQKNALRLVSGTPAATLGQIDISSGGLQFGVLDGNVGAFINALEGIGDTDVIAAPHLLCLNKQKAEILIGDQKGYLSTTQTETATTQTVEFLDIGTQLRIRPFISSDGMVRLEVHPELSTGDVKLVGEFALPEKSTTQVTSNIMCRDGCTVVIGGLIREDHARTITQAAIIGNLPILGQLFRNKKVENQRTEIIVLLTPKVVHDPMICEDSAACRAAVSQRRAAVAMRKISPIARHHYGRRYYRLAQSAWYAGNMPEAHRYLDIALRMNPRDIMARRLMGIMMSGEGQSSPHLDELPVGENEQFNGHHEQSTPLEPEPLPEVEPTQLQTPRHLVPPEPPNRETSLRGPIRHVPSLRTPTEPHGKRVASGIQRPAKSPVQIEPQVRQAGLHQIETLPENTP